MKICFLAKKEKPGVYEAIDFLKREEYLVDIFFAESNSVFPKQIINTQYDILVSYISNWIVPIDVLNKTKLWNINFHPGPPEYPGTGCFNFSIYNNESNYGSTAHLMNPAVDTGKIIGVNRFETSQMENVKTLSDKTYVSLLALFKDVFKYISKNKTLPKCSEKWKRKPYKRRELEKLATLNCNMSLNQIKKIIRATYYPGKPAPFIEINGLRFEYNPDR